jgi:hypothetical protein
MPNRKVFLGKIKNSLPLKEMAANLLLNEQPAPLRINFDHDQSALLDPGHPRAVVWAKMIDLLQKDNRPAYVEVDPETDIITRLCIPIAAKVLEILPADQEVVSVTLNATDALHVLRRDLPDFQKFYDVLQYAKNTGSEILVTATLHDFEIVDVRALPSSFGNEGPDEPPPQPGPIVPISPERSVELFNMVNAQSCVPCSSASPCIPYKYPYNGCWIRAHLMCYLMVAEGVTPEKTWIFGKLKARSSNVPQCKVGWGWHVAPTLMVTQTGDAVVKMVIDPSLCDEPVTEAYWKSLQGDPGAKLTPAAWEGYRFLASGTASQPEADNDMEYFRLALDELCAEYGPSPYKCPPVKNGY